MAVEVPCPKCRSVLRAPEGMPGKKVRCKKCGEGFRLPGAVPANGSGDSQMISAAETPAVKAAASVSAIAVTPAGAPAAAFTFDDPDTVVTPPKGSRAWGRGEREGAKTGGSGGMMLILGLAGGVGLMGLVGAAIGAYFFFSVKTQEVATNPPPPTASAPATADNGAATTTPTPAANAKKEADAEKSDKTQAEGGAPNPSPTPAPPQAKPKALPKAPTRTSPSKPTFQMPKKPKGPLEVIARPKERFEVEVPPDAIRAVRFSESDPAMMAVLWVSSPGFQGQGAQHSVDIHNAGGGPQLGRVDFPADGFNPAFDRPFDLSQDGNRIAIESNTPGKLTVYDVGSKTRLLDNVDAFAKDPGVERSGLSALRFASPDRLLAVDHRGGVDVWDLKAKQVVASAPPFAPPLAKPTPPSLASVSRVRENRVMIFAGGMLAVASPTTGATTGAPLQLADPGLTAGAVAFAPTGTKAAVVAGTPTGGQLFVLNVQAAATIARRVQFPTELGPPSGVQFSAGSDFVVVQANAGRTAAVMDLETGVVNGYLTPEGEGIGARQIPNEEQGRYLWTMPVEGSPNKTQVLAVEMPFDGFFDLAPAAKAARTPVYLSLRDTGIAK